MVLSAAAVALFLTACCSGVFAAGALMSKWRQGEGAVVEVVGKGSVKGSGVMIGELSNKGLFSWRVLFVAMGLVLNSRSSTTHYLCMHVHALMPCLPTNPTPSPPLPLPTPPLPQVTRAFP